MENNIYVLVTDITFMSELTRHLFGLCHKCVFTNKCRVNSHTNKERVH